MLVFPSLGKSKQNIDNLIESKWHGLCYRGLWLIEGVVGIAMANEKYVGQYLLRVAFIFSSALCDLFR